jgi:hypothetical protein
MLSHYAESHNVECHCSECRGAFETLETIVNHNPQQQKYIRECFETTERVRFE